MTTNEKLVAKYGNPLAGQVQREMFEKTWMTVLKYPSDILMVLPCLGQSLYCNKDFAPEWVKLLRAWIAAKVHTEIKTNDECFLPRYIRGTTTTTVNDISVHTWGMAADLNPADNPLGLTREQAIAKGLKPFSIQFQQIARDNGFVAGIDFPRGDGMHYQFTKQLTQNQIS